MPIPRMTIDDELWEQFQLLKDENPSALHDVLCLTIFLAWKENKINKSGMSKFLWGAWIYYTDFLPTKSAR